jgi:hypothetical protein
MGVRNHEFRFVPIEAAFATQIGCSSSTNQVMSEIKGEKLQKLRESQFQCVESLKCGVIMKRVRRVQVATSTAPQK